MEQVVEPAQRIRLKKKAVASLPSSNFRVIQGGVFDVLSSGVIAPGSIDCCVTSPPYWALRSYLPNAHPLKSLELGREATPAEYVANVVRWCRLVRDCLADHGTFWLNVGDSYSHDSRGGETGGKHVNWHGQQAMSMGRTLKLTPVPAGNLCLIPQRLMIALQDDGWFVRSVVVWHKLAPMPCSVKGWMWMQCRVKLVASLRARDKKRVASNGKPHGDRDGKEFASAAKWTKCPGCKKCAPNSGLVLRKGSWRPTSSYEPVIMLAKSANYFADGEAVMTPPAESTVNRDQYTRVIDDPDEQFAVAHDHETVCAAGANLRDVWTIAHEPLKEAHYAAYPTELVYRCLAAGTSQEGYCTACGGPFVRVVEHKNAVIQKSERAVAVGNRTTCSGTQSAPAETRTVGWRPSCKCPNPMHRPGRVLDPFCGSGRSGIVARRLGLDFTGCELNPEYAEMGRQLIQNDQPLFNEMETAATNSPSTPGLFDDLIPGSSATNEQPVTEEPSSCP